MLSLKLQMNSRNPFIADLQSLLLILSQWLVVVLQQQQRKKSSSAQTAFLQGPEFQLISVKKTQLQNFDSFFMRFFMNVFA